MLTVGQSEQKLKIAILVLSSAVLAGGAALFLVHRASEPRARAATEEPPAADRAATSSLGPRPGAPRPAHLRESGPATADSRPQSSASLPGADLQSGNSAPAGDAPPPTPTAAKAQAVEADDVAAPKPAARHDAIRVNPTSGEQMWSAQDVIRDGGEANQPLCGGQLCRVGQFCCGPPACGRCAYPMAGPRCPGTCPGEKSN
jgi:hypothetical protein